MIDLETLWEFEAKLAEKRKPWDEARAMFDKAMAEARAALANLSSGPESGKGLEGAPRVAEGRDNFKSNGQEESWQ